MSIELSRRNIMIVGAVSFVLGIVIASRVDWSHFISEESQCLERGGAWAITRYERHGKLNEAIHECLDPRYPK